MKYPNKYTPKLHRIPGQPTDRELYQNDPLPNINLSKDFNTTDITHSQHYSRNNNGNFQQYHKGLYSTYMTVTEFLLFFYLFIKTYCILLYQNYKIYILNKTTSKAQRIKLLKTDRKALNGPPNSAIIFKWPRTKRYGKHCATLFKFTFLQVALTA